MGGHHSLDWIEANYNNLHWLDDDNGMLPMSGLAPNWNHWVTFGKAVPFGAGECGN